jgi:hypothetical protein
MLDASNGSRPGDDHPPHTEHADATEAPASERRDFGETHEEPASGTARPEAVTLVSIRKIEANRRNAQHSAGPRTDAGKRASRMNALKHGLLANEVVITRGDYKEDEEAFTELLLELREQFTPVGVAEELEVQRIALCYWRTRRAIRYEHGAIRQRTGNVRWRERLDRKRRFDEAVRGGADLDHSSHGIGYLIGYLEYMKQEVLAGKVSGEALEWLVTIFPNQFALPDTMEPGDAKGYVTGPSEYFRELLAEIDAQLRSLPSVSGKVTRIEQLDLDSKIRTAALPASRVVEKLVRYETSNDRELDRALKRLERMQERRRATGGTHQTN